MSVCVAPGVGDCVPTTLGVDEMTLLSDSAELLTPPAVVLEFNPSGVTNDVSKAGNDMGCVGLSALPLELVGEDTPFDALIAFTVEPAPAIKFSDVA